MEEPGPPIQEELRLVVQLVSRLELEPAQVLVVAEQHRAQFHRTRLPPSVPFPIAQQFWGLEVVQVPHQSLMHHMALKLPQNYCRMHWPLLQTDPTQKVLMQVEVP